MNISMWFRKPRLNWKREPTDPRDRKFEIPLRAVPLPNAMTNRKFMSPVKNQKSLGCCVGEGSTAAVEYTERQFGIDMHFIGSELFCYYNARVNKTQDTGGYVRDSIKAMATFGVAHEEVWPFVISKFSQFPSHEAYEDAAKTKITSYARLSGLNDILAAIAAGHVVIGGFDAYQSVFGARGGVVPVPSWNDRLAGGHCVCFCGFNQKLRIVEFKNSWGPGWGDQGYGYLPFWYFENGHVADCWVLYK